MYLRPFPPPRIQVLYAWSAPDVLFVSMVTTTLEIQNFVNFVLGDHCDGLNKVLRVVFDRVRPSWVQMDAATIEKHGPSD